MAVTLKCAIVLSFILLISCTKFKIVHNNSHVTNLPYSVELNDLINEGIFQRFIRHLLDLLSAIMPDKKVVRYCRMLGRELRSMDFKYTKDLAKHLRFLSRMYREELKNELRRYRLDLKKRLPYRSEFLKAMDEVFTLKENILFDDYIYNVKDYGFDHKLYIHDETRKILRDVILGSIYKLSSRDQNDLEKKLKRALKEHRRITD